MSPLLIAYATGTFVSVAYRVHGLRESAKDASEVVSDHTDYQPGPGDPSLHLIIVGFCVMTLIAMALLWPVELSGRALRAVLRRRAEEKTVRVVQDFEAADIHFSDPNYNDAGVYGMVCGEDVSPNETQRLGSPFTFNMDQVTCPQCVSWINQNLRTLQ